MDYTDEELKLFEELTNSLVLWLFDTDEKKYAINKIIREAYDKGKETNKPQ